ncbi:MULTISPECIES: hypothetical protein [unclassified Lentimonas]|uniref:hypothetical protein n=1 Tax=unclassified Lentimonas TaxID=2630993 RepID=UPI001324B34B|nr:MULTISPECIES: hypothetical protein [unclassified Lentimonas]CAA6692404.1 Unannotated [Lentimonas sp. CC19]CAA6693984.1 Unannotated [Lentimonas sp. CC10]CAA7072222.1 Unannotated [Lentimonas sp. CC11]
MKNRQSGFALVIALSLMAFVLLLLLSITTMVQVESRNASSTLHQLEARQNARLAAMIAVGDLQKYAGVDQRVTARSDILLAPSSTPRIPLVTDLSSGVDGQRYWTGVWSSKAATNDAEDALIGLDNHGVKWLVSGDTPNPSLDPNIAVTGQTVMLAKANQATGSLQGSSVESVAQSVLAPLVDIIADETASGGQYAYWVSDDGVKARVNIPDPYEPSIATDPLSAYHRMAMVQQGDASVAVANANADAAPEQPFAPTGSAESYWKTAASPVGQVASQEMIPFIASTADSGKVSRGFFHDLTTNSASLIVNTRDGGIKRDLSAALLNLPDDLNGTNSDHGNRMFPSANGSDALATGPGFPYDETVGEKGDPGGPTWRQLADYYQYCQLHSGDDKSDPIDLSNDTDLLAYHEDRLQIAPIVTRFNFIIQAFAEGTGTDATDFSYRAGMFPLVTLWNPYDRDMIIPDLGFYTVISSAHLYHEDYLDLDDDSGNAAKIRGVTASEVPSVNLLGNIGLKRSHNDEDGSRTFVGFTIKGITIPAGETVNFSPPINSLYDKNEVTNNVLMPGTNIDAVSGFFGDSFAFDGTTATVTSAPPMDMYKTGSVGDISRMRISSRSPADYAAGKWGFVDVALFTLEISPDDRSYLEKRIMAAKTVAFGKPYVYLPRVVALEQLGLALNVGAKGSSDGAGFDLASAVSVTALYESTYYNQDAPSEGTFAGYSRSLNLPRDVVVGDNAKVNLFSQMNVRSPLQIKQFNETQGGFGYDMYDYGQYDVTSNYHENFIKGVTDVNSYIGLADGRPSEGGSSQMVLFETPDRVPLSVGQLGQANLANVHRISNQVEKNKWLSNYQGAHVMSSYAIGNSLANICLPLDVTRTDIRNSNMFSGSADIPGNAGNSNGAYYDYSYELNDALWDEFFFSTIQPSNVTNAVYPNARMKRLDGASDSDIQDESRAAANLLIEGGFNINSTSVAAWESILGALRDVPTLGGDATGIGHHNFSRLYAPPLDSTDTDPSYLGDKDSIVAGFRSLSDAQILDLSNEIVREIRMRGAAYGYPFTSLSRFVNRSLVPVASGAPSGEILNSALWKKRFAYCGALQFAIDQSGVNGDPGLDEEWNGTTGSALWDSNYATPVVPSGLDGYFADSLDVIKSRPLAEGIPGTVIQSDLLSKVGAIITPRSDTFTIRSYGSSKDPITGEVDSECYLEVVVQRMPEYIEDRAQGAVGDYSYDPATTDLNKLMGRKFSIISSRWLSANEI